MPQSCVCLSSHKQKVTLSHGTAELCKSIKMNVEATDRGTKTMMKIAEAVPFELMFVVLAVACFFCGNVFSDDFRFCACRYKAGV